MVLMVSFLSTLQFLWALWDFDKTLIARNPQHLLRHKLYGRHRKASMATESCSEIFISLRTKAFLVRVHHPCLVPGQCSKIYIQ